MLQIKKVIKNKGLEVKEIAKILGVSDNTMSTYINGNPTITTLQKIADALNVHITELFEQPTKNNNTPTVSGFIKIDNQIHEIKSIEQLTEITTAMQHHNNNKTTQL